MSEVDDPCAVARAEERSDIVTEIIIRCEALRHPRPCHVCDTFIMMIGGRDADVF